MGIVPFTLNPHLTVLKAVDVQLEGFQLRWYLFVIQSLQELVIFLKWSPNFDQWKMDTSENQLLFKITSAEDPLIEEHKERHEKMKGNLEYSDNKDAER